MSPSHRDLAALPKAHLHLHIEGGMRPDTLRELAAEHGVEVPTLNGYGDFSVFNDTYDAAFSVLRHEEEVRRLIRETVEDARADGAVYVEPGLYLPPYRARFGADEAIVELYLDELAHAGDELGVGTGLQIAADRTMPVAEAEELARLAARYAGRGVVSFGLSSDERNHPPEPFADAFALAREAGLVAAPHAGELAGPESVSGALDALGATRIQHGVRALEDPALVARLVDEGVYLDVCPSSNVMLSVYPSLASHPLPELLHAGVRCTLNADDPLLFGPTLLEEYRRCRSEIELDDGALAAMARFSLQASVGAPPEVVSAALEGVDAWLSEPQPEKNGGH